MQLVIVATAMYFVLGTFMDSVSILAITIPSLYPVVLSMGLGTILFAMVMILATQIGNITPPVGLNIYAVKGVAGDEISLGDLCRSVLPFSFSW